jgi:hypothetical protein
MYHEDELLLLPCLHGSVSFILWKNEELLKPRQTTQTEASSNQAQSSCIHLVVTVPIYLTFSINCFSIAMN